MEHERAAGWLGGYRSALAHRDLRWLLGSYLVSGTGTWAYNVALVVLVFERTDSLVWVSAASLVRLLSGLACSAYAGVIAERTERIRLMVGAGVVCALWQVGLAVDAAANGPVVFALVFAALTSATSTVYRPAMQATIRSVVNEDDLVAANALVGTIANVIVVAGPAVGAALLAVGSPAAAFAVNAGSFAVSSVLIWRVRARSRPVDVTEGGRAGPLRQIAVGARTIARLPAARTLVAFSALASFVYGTDIVLFVAVAQHKLGTGSEGFGFLVAAMGVGGILMAPAVDHFARSRSFAPIIVGGMAGACLPTALLVVIHSAALAGVPEIVRGASTLVVEVLLVTGLQRAISANQLARVFGVHNAILLGAIALGTLVTPPSVSLFGLDACLVAMAFAPVALALLGYRALASIDRKTYARTEALEPIVAVLERLGIFATASRALLEGLAAAATVAEFPRGVTIVREGEAADALYVLVEGEVEVTARGEAGGPERSVRTMTAPAYFGEIGVLEHIPRTATVTALTDCRCQRIEGDAFLEALDAAPPSSALMENERTRLALTHPSRPVTFAPDDPA